MELIERAGFLEQLQKKAAAVTTGEGGCVFISGEAGIGKTSLLKNFCRALQNDFKIFNGTCDALFTPRPLAPLYDIAWQIRNDFWQDTDDNADRSVLFIKFFEELSKQKSPSLIVFEDIHWADEASFDFIKFLARRINGLHCLFVLTYRDDEMHAQHLLRNLLGQLPPDNFSRMQLTPLSKEAVKKMAGQKGYSGDDVYRIAGGNPFYVSEILASYSAGIPASIRDSILSTYNRTREMTRRVWDLLSVVPSSLELEYFERLEPQYAGSIDDCIQSNIIFLKNGRIYFKHELFRATIENSLSPLKRVALNKRILNLLIERVEYNPEIERIIHHAKNANETDLVVYYAPLAARKAASMGSHIEAAKLFLTAIEYYRGNNKERLIDFYESYAYECYVTNQIKEAIVYTTKALILWKEKNDPQKTANCLQFLSRLWWFDANMKKAEQFGKQAVDILENQPISGIKAKAFSNISQLKVLANQPADSMVWGEKAVEMARELNDTETLSYVLNNLGAIQVNRLSTLQNGIKLLQESLAIALENSYHEHVAHAYNILAVNSIATKNYSAAEKTLGEGIAFCNEIDLDSWTAFMSSLKAIMFMETGYWEEAVLIADKLLMNESQPHITKTGALMVSATIRMRRGDHDMLPLLLEAKTKAFEIKKLQKIIPVMTALFEYEWMTGKYFIKTESLDYIVRMIECTDAVFDNTFFENSQFAFWLFKARGQHLPLKNYYPGYLVSNVTAARRAAELWKKLGCPYEQAITLFEGNDTDKRNAIHLLQKLGANAVAEKLKLEMRVSGLKGIPRGMRKSTQSNSALLTERELEVLELLKQGLQNKEMAGRLFLSPRTIDNHVTSILFKLDVNSRTKAVQAAARMQILN